MRYGVIVIEHMPSVTSVATYAFPKHWHSEPELIFLCWGDNGSAGVALAPLEPSVRLSDSTLVLPMISFNSPGCSEKLPRSRISSQAFGELVRDFSGDYWAFAAGGCGVPSE